MLSIQNFRDNLLFQVILGLYLRMNKSDVAFGPFAN